MLWCRSLAAKASTEDGCRQDIFHWRQAVRLSLGSDAEQVAFTFIGYKIKPEPKMILGLLGKLGRD